MCPCILVSILLEQDLLLSKVTPQQLRFSSPFTLVSISEQRTKVHAFLLYFDIFFTVTGDAVPPETEVAIISEGDPVVAEVWPVGGKPASKRRQSMGEGNKDKIASFSTGPKSVPTHWKQTLFLLRKPFSVSEGKPVSARPARKMRSYHRVLRSTVLCRERREGNVLLPQERE
jgi:protein arginine N-methyltransferase 3